MCMGYTCQNTCVEVRGQFRELVLSFHHVDYGDQTRNVRLGTNAFALQAVLAVLKKILKATLKVKGLLLDC